MTDNFIPSSNLIEEGFGLTAGKIDPGYGKLDGKRQQIRFGMKNLRNEENILEPNQVVAYVYFVDLRGLNNNAFRFSNADRKRLVKIRDARYERVVDDGVYYEEGD
jgi:deoxycytidine triphosphate deaminase